MPAAALAAPKAKVVRYHGYHVLVPANWPVYSLAKHPTLCVRFDRHAVYLGHPGADQHCTTTAAGRTEAILIEPLNGPRAAAAPALPGAGNQGSLVDRGHDIAVTVTWNRNAGLITRALGLRSLSSLAAGSRRKPAQITRAVRRGVRAVQAAATPGEVYTGAAFDACSTPSSAKMAAWSASLFRGIGVYIGGANMACSQPNLTGNWVVQQSAGGWHLIPIYVGLQAPSNSCGCAAIVPRLAAGEGRTAALGAIANAQAIDLGPGNPIYYDMEAYARRRRNTSAVMTFLQAWTRTLHAAGYASGVYSSESSGIADMAARVGTSYTEPDDIWIANWNGAHTTADASLPTTDWASHQRIHQFRGDHNERHGHVRINIDSDYVDAATAAAGSATAAVASIRPALSPVRPHRAPRRHRHRRPITHQTSGTPRASSAASARTA
jgi:hypothetical protein